MLDPRLLIVVAAISGAAVLQDGLGERNAERRTNDFRYTPDPRVMRLVAGGDRSTFADAIWLSVLPDMAQPFSDRALKKRWLQGATDVVTDLEPSFGTAYSYGAAHLNIVDKNPDAAIALLTKGIEKNPGSAGLHVQLAMVYFEYKHDKRKTIELLEAASTLDGIDSLSLAMLASLHVDERDDFMALAVWEKNLAAAPNRKSRTICEFEWWRAKALIANRASREFAKDHDGRPPANAADVRDPKYMSDAVAQVVCDGLTFDEKGGARYERLTELEREIRIFQAADLVAAFIEGTGKPPTEKEFFESFGRLPEPPKGQKWQFADGKLSLVAE